MTPKKMHVEVDLLLQKVLGHRYDKFEEEEIDHFLNNEQLRFIRSRATPKSNIRKEGLDQTVKRYQDLEELKSVAILPVYNINSTTDFVVLPPDVFHFINSESTIYWDCSDIVTNLAQDNINVYSGFVKLDLDIYNASNFYKDLKIVYSDDVNGSRTLFDITSYYPDGLPDPELKFSLVDLILEVVKADPSLISYDLRWEYHPRVPNTGYQGNFFILTLGVTGPNAKLTLTYNNYSSQSTIGATTFQTYQTNGLSNTKNVDNRLIKVEEVREVLSNSFSKTTRESPVTVYDGNALALYHNEKFIFNTVKVDYIRQPRRISLPLERSCELPERVHDELVEATARRVANVIQAGNRQELIRENLISE